MSEIIMNNCKNSGGLEMISRESFQRRMDAMTTTASCRSCPNPAANNTYRANYSSTAATAAAPNNAHHNTHHNTHNNNHRNNQLNQQHHHATNTSSANHAPSRRPGKSHRNRKREATAGYCELGKRAVNRQRYTSQSRNVHHPATTATTTATTTSARKPAHKLSHNIDNQSFLGRCPLISEHPYIDHRCNLDEKLTPDIGSNDTMVSQPGIETMLSFPSAPSQTNNLSSVVSNRVLAVKPRHIADKKFVDEIPTEKIKGEHCLSAKKFDNRLNANATEFQSREYQTSPSPPLVKPHPGGFYVPGISQMPGDSTVNYIPPGNSIVTTMDGVLHHSTQFPFTHTSDYEVTPSFTATSGCYLSADDYMTSQSYPNPAIEYPSDDCQGLPHDCTCIPPADSVVVYQSPGKAVVSVGDISDDPADILCDACLTRQHAASRLASEDLRRLTTVAIDLTGYDTAYTVHQPVSSDDPNVFIVDYSTRISRSRQVVRRMNSVYRLTNGSVGHAPCDDDDPQPHLVATECRYSVYNPAADCTSTVVDYEFDSRGDLMVHDTNSRSAKIWGSDGESQSSSSSSSSSSTSSSPPPIITADPYNNADIDYNDLDHPMAECYSAPDLGHRVYPDQHTQLQPYDNAQLLATTSNDHHSTEHQEQPSLWTPESLAMGYLPEPVVLPRSVLLNDKVMSMLPAHLAQQFVRQVPPPRKWKAVKKEPSSTSFIGGRSSQYGLFSVMSYNILCDLYATPQQYSYCPSYALAWQYRSTLIINDIKRVDADIIALQEVEIKDYHGFFLNELARVGYKGFFAPKSRSHSAFDQYRCDGCAIFYKKAKFFAIEKHVVDFGSIGTSVLSKHPDIQVNRLTARDNIAIVMVLTIKKEFYHDSLDEIREHKLIVSNCHLHWDPEYCDVKLLQTMIMCSSIDKIKEQHTDQLTGVSPSIVLCGDFNSLPYSGPIEFLSHGNVSIDHPDFKAIAARHSFSPLFSIDSMQNTYNNTLNLNNAYANAEMTSTNYTQDFKGVIDYIFSSNDTISTVSVLSGVPVKWFEANDIAGCPHIHVPSDHMPIVALLLLETNSTDTSSISSKNSEPTTLSSSASSSTSSSTSTSTLTSNVTSTSTSH